MEAGGGGGGESLAVQGPNGVHVACVKGEMFSETGDLIRGESGCVRER